MQDRTVSPRLTRWVEENFGPGTSEPVLEALRALPESSVGGQDVERVQASLVLGTGGDWSAFRRRLALVAVDWRDALVGAGLGHEDWPERLDEVLGAPELRARFDEDAEA